MYFKPFNNIAINITVSLQPKDEKNIKSQLKLSPSKPIFSVKRLGWNITCINPKSDTFGMKINGSWNGVLGSLER